LTTGGEIDKNKRAQQVLEQFGLSSNEARVYQSALTLGETSPFKIAKSTGIARTTVYAVLTDLALKGLIELESSTGLMKQQTKVKAKNPSVLRDILWQKRADTFRQEVDIVEILPFLKKEYLKDETNADFQFFPGSKGAEQVTFDFDNIDQDSYVFDYLTPMDVFGTTIINRGVEEAIKFQSKANSTEFNLIPITPWTKHVLTYQVERNPHYLDHVEHRHLPFELGSMSIWLHIKNGRIRIVSIKGDEVWGLKIRSQNLANSLIGVHQALWKLATPITKDMIASWGPNQYMQAEKQSRAV
jgi:hypothetical protein